MSIRFDGRVAIVTGAGSGLGRAYAMGLAARGAKVLVNDLGEGDGSGRSASAQAVAEEITQAGGAAIPLGADVAKFDQVEAMTRRAFETWGRLDILVSNAGIIRKCAFGELSLDEFARVVNVHLWGAVHLCKAAWPIMCAQEYGRIVLAASSAGLYGSAANSAYCAAKSGLVGLMHALHLDGAEHNIRVNAIAPTAATNMNRALLPPQLLPLMAPEAVAPGVLYLAGEDAPSRTVLSAGAGVFSTAKIFEGRGVYLAADARTPETVAARFSEIADLSAPRDMDSAVAQTTDYVRTAAKAEGVDLGL